MLPNTTGTSNQDEKNTSSNNQISVPSISLPKGGGAIRGIGEKFAANPVTGTGSMTVPIATSPGRSGFGPQLSLSYDSGVGNGPFGFGWSLSLPAITRKTDKGLPLYRDAEESDVYILSGAEDLVPEFKKDATGKWIIQDGKHVILEEPRTVDGITYCVRHYRPRIEGLFARIERWTNKGSGEIHWRSISRDNITTIYGKTNNSRIYDPNDINPQHPTPTRIFSWLICESYDDKGNAIVYEYLSEDSQRIFEDQQGQLVALAHERNRNDATRSANRYLKCIKYGNRMPNRDATTWQATDPAQLPNDTWMFEVVFDYDQGYYAEDEPDAQERILARALIDPPSGSHWSVRQDPFSTYRASFEVRTYRLCRRVLLFHHFPQELGINDCLVRSTEFSYAESPIASFITSVTQSGYVRQPIQNQPNRYLKQSLPPLEFEYSQVPSPEELARQPIREVDAESLENLPVGLDGASYQWMDLDGEATSGILTEQADGWYYKRNLSANNQVREDGHERTAARFGPMEVVASKPAIGLADGGQFLDLAGDGQVDLVQMEGPLRGFYERTEYASWMPFQPFVSWPNLSTRDPDLRFVDLTGDGHADILVTEGEALSWYPSLAEDGFGPTVRVSLPLDEEKGPRLVFSDGLQSIYLADLSGDGLSDLVRIRNGEVCYWPNLGYGRFGAKVTMDNAPWFDSPDQFDQRRIRLADTDGSGTTDILYLQRDGVRIYFNQSGNRWSDAIALPQFPPSDTISSVQALDLLGNGTACLVWSSPLPGAARRPMRYLALMEEKPHLLVGAKNNLGAETMMHYAPSTKFYLDDKRDGKPWITRLPFPVHVVERVETYDRISRNHIVTRYAYHHGYFDGVEREFRGFGMVEQWDTEVFAVLNASDAFPSVTNIDEASHVPPVWTKTWFHTGAILDGSRISRQFDEEYYRESDLSENLLGLTEEQFQAMLLDDTVLPDTICHASGARIPHVLSVEEAREACRTLKGSILRQEIYALDDTDKEDRPYSVSERNYTLELLQPMDKNRHAVLFAHPRESIDFHYERQLYDIQGKQLADPRVTHNLTLKVDGYGNVLRSVSIAYGRRHPDPDLTSDEQKKQKRTHITFTENDFTTPIDLPDNYRTPMPSESRTYELLKVTPQSLNAIPVSMQSDITPLFRFEELNGVIDAISDGKHDLSYEDWNSDESKLPNTRRRLIEQVRTLYRKNDLTSFSPLGTVEWLALPGESYKLAFTTNLLKKIYVDTGKLSTNEVNTVFGTDGAYVHSEGDVNWWIPFGRMFLSPSSNDTAMQEVAYARQHFFLPHRYRNPFHTNALSTESFLTYDGYDLLMLETRDALGNRVTVGERNVDPTQPLVRHGHDYRVLQPALIMDPNRNRSVVAFDALGMVVGTAVMGKPEDNPVPGDRLATTFHTDLTQAEIDQFFANPKGPIIATLLDSATTRIIYDLTGYWREPDPQKKPLVFAATLARETHTTDPVPAGGLKIQVSFSYSDGLGREIQKKVQAEPGPVPKRDANGKIIVGADGQPIMTSNDVSPRWVGSGWTVFNNKGKPVRQYEPFFTDTHRFEFDVKIGVSPVFFYDPVERVVATLHPNHIWEKVVFDPWQQQTWDVNDTLLVADPKTDADVGHFFRRLPDAEYLPTWHALRTDPAHAAAFTARYPDPSVRLRETQAAQKTQVHAGTPTFAHFDTLGRTFLTVAHNRFNYSDTPPADPPIEEFYRTRVVFDIEGNQREVRDERKNFQGNPEQRIVMSYDYETLGNCIHQASMEAGERWMLNDVAGKSIRAWDSRDHQFRTAYDQLRRPTDSFLREGAGAEMAVGRSIYGESRPNPEATNLRGKVVQLFDQAGVVTSDDYDFKGTLRRSQRQLAGLVNPQGTRIPAYMTIVDWSAAVQLEADTYTSHTRYDALNRPITVTTPDNSVYRPAFNEANLLDKVDLNLRGEKDTTRKLVWKPFVTNINYNAKGQRTFIRYANEAETIYEYDAQTYRLIHLKTTRPAGPNGLASQLFTDTTIIQDLHYTYDPVGNITHIADDAIQTIQYNNENVEPDADYIYDAIYRLVSAQGREHIGQTAFNFIAPHDNYRDYPFFGLHGNPNDLKAVRNYSETYNYDEVSNIKNIRHSALNGSWTRSYTYEETSLLEPGRKNNNRLTRTQVGNGLNFTESYRYTDAQGNDIHGCMTSINSMQMVWDFKDQLQTVNLGGGGKAYYVYDASGQRVRKVINRQNGTKQKERIYLGGFEIYREYNGAGGTTPKLERETLHVMDDKQHIAQVETQTIENSNPVTNPVPLRRYQIGNHLGSATVELDVDGALISYEEYHPYGTTAFQAGRSAAEVSLKRYRYTGKERDEESRLCYHEARYYGPWLGRWLSTDPRFIVDSLNLYCYCRSAPIVRHDTSGTQSFPANQTPAPVLSGTPDIYWRLATDPNYIREHWAPTGTAKLPLSERLQGVMSASDLARLERSVRNNTQTSPLRRDVAQAKTAFDNARTARAKLSNYNQTAEYLQTIKDTKSVMQAAGATSQEVASVPGLTASSYQASIVGEAVGVRYATSGQALPRNIAPLLRQPVSPPNTSAPKPVSVVSFPKPAGAAQTGKVVTSSAPATQAAPEPAKPGRISNALESPVTGFEADFFLKLLTQPVAENIADRVATASVNSMLKDIGGVEPMSVDEANQLAPGHRAALSAVISEFPPGIDIAVTAAVSAVAYHFTEFVANPVWVEYVRQFPTPVDFFNKVYGG